MPIDGHLPERQFAPRMCSACRPKNGTTPEHGSCRYAYGCECWCLDGQPHRFPPPEEHP